MPTNGVFKLKSGLAIPSDCRFQNILNFIKIYSIENILDILDIFDITVISSVIGHFIVFFYSHIFGF